MMMYSSAFRSQLVQPCDSSGETQESPGMEETDAEKEASGPAGGGLLAHSCL